MAGGWIDDSQPADAGAVHDPGGVSPKPSGEAADRRAEPGPATSLSTDLYGAAAVGTRRHGHGGVSAESEGAKIVA